MGRGRGSDRSYAPITVEHLRCLERIAKEDREAMFARHPHLAVYRDRVLMVALCQGAALHYVNGTNGVKDLDVYTFYSEVPGVLLHPRRSVAVDFGESEFGFWSKERPIKGKRFIGRRVDLLQRSIRVPVKADPVEAITDWLQRDGGTPSLLTQKAVVGIWPDNLRGEIIWPL